MSIIAKFPVTLSESFNEIINVPYETRDGSAEAGTDYQTASGVLEFQPGETVKDINVLIYDRAGGSPDINFYLDLQPTTNAVLGDVTGECIITTDDEGNLSSYRIVVMSGPQGNDGKSAYQVAVDNGFVGTQEDWLNSLRGGTEEEIADAVAPIIDINPTYVLSQGTGSFGVPDQKRVDNFARRIAYASPALIGRITLNQGSNDVQASDLSGDAIDFNSPSMYPRFFRLGSKVDLSWSYDEETETITVDDANENDYMYVVQYDFINSDVAALIELIRDLKSGAFTQAGTAASKNVGTSPGNVLEYGAGGLLSPNAVVLNNTTPTELLDGDHGSAIYNPGGVNAGEGWDTDLNAVLLAMRNPANGFYLQAGKSKDALYARVKFEGTVFDSVRFAFTGAEQNVSFGDTTVKKLTADQVAAPYNIFNVGGSSHTVTSSDLGKILVFDTTSACTLTVPSAANNDLPDGFFVQFRNKQSGNITVAKQGSDVIAGAGTITAEPRKLSSVYKESDGVWVTSGDLG